MAEKAKATKKEDGSTNSLGSIPMGRLTRKSPAAKKRHGYYPGNKSNFPHESIAGALLREVAPDFKVLALKTPFDSNKLPELQQAITTAVGSAAEVQYDNVKNAFYVDATPEVVAKIMDVMKSMQIDVELVDPAAPKPQDAPSAVGTGSTSTPVNPEAVDANAGEPNEEAGDMGPLVADDDSPSPDAFDPNPAASDDEILKGGRLNDIMHRLLAKINRAPRAHQSDLYRHLMMQVMQAVEPKAGASSAMLGVAKSFMKDGF